VTEPNPTPDAAALAGRVAVVAGGGSRGDGIGNGRAAAILLARHGACVGVFDAEPAWAQATIDLIHAEGGRAVGFGVDVTDDVQVKAGMAAVAQEFGPPSILVNNVGISGPVGTAETVDLDAWDAALRVNVTSMVLTVRHALPYLRAAGSGSIVNNASIFGLVGGHHALLYPTSKAAVIGLTRAMAAHHGSEGIRVNCVAPGSVYTPMVTTLGMSEEMREDRRHQGILTTEGTGWDVANAILYLASPMSKWVTGIVLPVDAGLTSGKMRPIHVLPT
jgi:NAD(P)-dependent dehydrogenase (short-subunit alcohol dehydrogenase family)